MKRILLFLAVAGLVAPAARAQLFSSPMTPTTPSASMSLGAGLPAALASPANTSGGVPLLGGTVASGNCLVWGANGIQDAGSACATSNITGMGAPIATSLSNRATDFAVTFNLKDDFGAKCDGSTDDTTAIQSWLSKAAPGVHLVAPGRTCLFSSPVAAAAGAVGYSVTGAGQFVTIFRYTGATTSSNIFALGASNVTAKDFNVSTASTVTGCPFAYVNGVCTPPTVDLTNGDAIDMRALGVVADGYAAADAVISASSTSMTSASRNCQSPDAGKIVVIAGAGAASAPLHTTVASCSGSTYILATAASTAVAANTNAASWAIGTDNSPTLASAASAIGGTHRFIAPVGEILLDADATVALNYLSIEGANVPQNRTAALGKAAVQGSTFLITGQSASPFTIYKSSSIAGVSFFYPAQAGVTSTPVIYPPLIVDNGASSASDFTFYRSNCINCYDFFTQTNPSVVLGAFRVIHSNIYSIRHDFTLSNVGEQVYTEDDLFNPSVYNAVAGAGNQYLAKWTIANGAHLYVNGNGTSSVCSTTVAEINEGPGTVVNGKAIVWDIVSGHFDESQFASGADANQDGQLLYVAPAGLVTDTTWSGVGIANGAFGIAPSAYAFDMEGTCGSPVGDLKVNGHLGSLNWGVFNVQGTNMRQVSLNPVEVDGYGIGLEGAPSAPIYYANINNQNAVVNLSGSNIYSFYNTTNYEGVNVVNATVVNASGLSIDNTYAAFDVSSYASGQVNIVANSTTGTGGSYSAVGSASANINIGTSNKFDKPNATWSTLTVSGPSGAGARLNISELGAGSAVLGFQDFGIDQWTFGNNSTGNSFSLSDKTSGSIVQWLGVTPGGTATIGEGTGSTITVGGQFVANFTSVFNGVTTVSAASGSQARFNISEVGGGTAVFGMQNGSTDEYTFGYNPSGNSFVMNDKTSGSAVQWLGLSPGGNASLGEANSNVLTVVGTIGAKSGAVPTVSGTCAVGTQLGGQIAGSFKASAACSSGAVILTFAATQPNGYVCETQDETTSADAMKQTAHSTTSVTFTGTMAANDVVVFKCIGF